MEKLKFTSIELCLVQIEDLKRQKKTINESIKSRKLLIKNALKQPRKLIEEAMKNILSQE
jgi:hypothetical protein